MTRFRNVLFLAALLALVGQVSSRAATNASPDLQEVMDLIRQHATGLSAEDLNRAAVQGLVNALGPKVRLTATNSANESEAPASLAETTVFDGRVAYFRITSVTAGLAKAIDTARDQLNATNKVAGWVLDLRYADGTDYLAATDVADLFISKSQPLLNWGKGNASSHEKTNSISGPVAVLVNGQTSGAAEALAAIVREANVGLVLGSRTAGNALVMEDFPLKDGEHLLIGSVPVKLGDGVALPAQGVKPDIEVTVSAEAERAYYGHPFLAITNLPGATASAKASAVTNAPRALFNEAELVREHRAGESPSEQTAKRVPDPIAPSVNDPVLGRALDLLKGLAWMIQNNP